MVPCLTEDCLRIIFTQLTYEENIYSCILVNRFWCRVAIPILWKSNFAAFTCYKKLYETIIYLLPTSSKELLIKNKIISSSTVLSYQPLFNYIKISSQVPSSFIEVMTKNLTNRKNYHLLERVIYKLFINNCVNIKDFYLITTQPLYQFPGALTCFSKLCTFTLKIRRAPSTLLLGMAQICKNIENLNIYYCNNNIPGLMKFIDVQTNLKSLSLIMDHTKKKCKQELSEIIERKAATLKQLSISPTITLLSPKFLPSLVNLQYLDLCNDNGNKLDKGSEEMQEWEKYISIASFSNLQHLKTKYLPFYNEYILVERSNGNILEIEKYLINKNMNLNYSEKLIKSIIRYCPKIEKLAIFIEPENLIGVKEILLNCNQLKWIELSTFNKKKLNCDRFLEILVNYSPKTLFNFYFNNDFIFTGYALRFFFENWKGRIPLTFYKDKFTKEHLIIMERYRRMVIFE
ncbi:hypothetical protein C1645_812149 [Glomus cerebriforme]|uniref:F-box domain-containing protein n=1 Tax=Glomus cerebriforme TaxID=658196 RepID=A0A397TL43_9GLOM|nr:hypothetical protein C1645_812149 [Glomus cerebriforme]